MASYHIKRLTSCMNSKNLIWAAFLVGTTLVCTAFSLTTSNDFDLAKRELLLRKIGHEILLNSGDSTSRVLPIQKLGEDSYRIRFENELTFKTDSLVKIIKRSLYNTNLDKYIVNVLNCSSKEVVYGYAIAQLKKDDIVACSGRRQPKGCYLIEINFQKSGISNSQRTYLIGGLNLLIVVGFITSRMAKARQKQTVEANGILKIGNTLFNTQKRNLVFGELTIELTSKESRLLIIFAEAPNTIIERNQLQKEIWEDEGVIVGRSLDMFISKLRKKLENDASITLKNIHGKGYKLEVGDSIA